SARRPAQACSDKMCKSKSRRHWSSERPPRVCEVFRFLRRGRRIRELIPPAKRQGQQYECARATVAEVHRDWTVRRVAWKTPSLARFGGRNAEARGATTAGPSLS